MRPNVVTKELVFGQHGLHSALGPSSRSRGALPLRDCPGLLGPFGPRRGFVHAGHGFRARGPGPSFTESDTFPVTQILIRNRATDLDARMHDGTTPLILAARLAVEGMLEDLINSHADVNAVDDLGKRAVAWPRGRAHHSLARPNPSRSPHAGKSALHWAAAVNNVEAAVALLKHGANKDMQNSKVRGRRRGAAQGRLSFHPAPVLADHGSPRPAA